MITNTGRTILAKYLIGQAPAYASHIALGVGTTPKNEIQPFDDYSEKNTLNFEVLRVPISSRGYVYDEAGVANIVFAGELPGDQRYLFSEIGIFSAKSNPAAGTQDSRMIYTFSESENWEYHNRTTASTIDEFVEPLNGELEGSIINPLDEAGNPVPVFRTNSNNVVFNSDARTDRYELPRFLNRALLISGDMSYIEETGGALSIKESTELDYYATHLHLTGITTNFNKNSAEDQLRLAFSVIDKDSEQSSAPEGQLGGVRIIIEFASSDVLDAQNFARFEIDLQNGPVVDGVSNDGLISADSVNFLNNRYFVVKKTFGKLIKSSSFTWNTINVVKVYAMAYDNTGSDAPSDKFYIALDGFRLENVTSQNPLYGMTGYTVIKTEGGQPVVKEANSSNIVEFRYGMDVA